MKTKIQDEPVVTVAVIVAGIMAFFTMAISLNWFDLAPEQLDTIENFLLIAGVPAALLASGFIARQFVKPMAKINRGE